MLATSSARLAELEQSTALLHREVERLRLENSELAKLRAENVKLQERNVQLAAELSVRTGEFSLPGEAAQLSDASSDAREAVGLPGDSFPAVAASLDDIESDTGTEDEEAAGTADRQTEKLLQKLGKGGNRMEQIKRQLVVQRGAIVSRVCFRERVTLHFIPVIDTDC